MRRRVLVIGGLVAVVTAAITIAVVVGAVGGDKPAEPPPTAFSGVELPSSIVFSKSWIEEYDEDPDPESVKITFLASWLTDGFPVKGYYPQVALHMSKDRVVGEDRNADPDWITLYLDSDWFHELTTHPQMRWDEDNPPPYGPPSTPLPESEVATFVFSKKWLMENNVSPYPAMIEVTFPSSWLTDPPPIAEEDVPVVLRMSKVRLAFENTNDDPDWITIRTSDIWFTGYSDDPG